MSKYSNRAANNYYHNLKFQLRQLDKIDQKTVDHKREMKRKVNHEYRLNDNGVITRKAIKKG